MAQQQGYVYTPKTEESKESVVEFKSETSDKYFIWHIQGGLGKNIAATALCTFFQGDESLYPPATYP